MTQPPYPPTPGVPPPGYASSEEKTWALVAHFGGAVGTFISCGIFGFVAPLVAFLAKGNESPTIRRHALAALNFQAPLSAISFLILVMSWSTAFLPAGLDFLISMVVLLVRIAVYILGVVFGILAGVRANEGREYRYPLGLSFIK